MSEIRAVYSVLWQTKSGHFIVRGVTDMVLIFEYTLSFNRKISDWDASNVTNM